MLRAFILSVFIFSYISLFCQNKDTTNCIIYKSYVDYINNKPLIKSNLNKGDKFKFVFPAGTETRLKVKIKSIDTIFKAGSIWGFEKKGFLFRYYEPNNRKEVAGENKLYYKIIYNKEVVIYTINHFPHEIPLYYYSKNLSTNIKKVKDENLSTDFSDKPKIIELIHKITNTQ